MGYQAAKPCGTMTLLEQLRETLAGLDDVRSGFTPLKPEDVFCDPILDISEIVCPPELDQATLNGIQNGEIGAVGAIPDLLSTSASLDDPCVQDGLDFIDSKVQELTVFNRIIATQSPNRGDLRRYYGARLQLAYWHAFNDAVQEYTTSPATFVSNHYGSQNFGKNKDATDERNNRLQAVRDVMNAMNSTYTIGNYPNFGYKLIFSNGVSFGSGSIPDYVDEESNPPSKKDVEQNPNVYQEKEEQLRNMRSDIEVQITDFTEKCLSLARLQVSRAAVRGNAISVQDFNDDYDDAVSDLQTDVDEFEGDDSYFFARQRVFEIKDEIESHQFCGSTVNQGAPPVEGSGEHLTLEEITSHPTMTDLLYWQRFSLVATTVNLLPIYWQDGIINPAGGNKIPVPTVWAALAVFPLPSFLNVVFLAVTGFVVTPVVWQLRFQPIADQDSYFLLSWRNANQKIKSNTGSKPLGTNIVSGFQYEFPSGFIPMSQDDLPAFHRLNITNPLFLSYLNEFCKTGKSMVGLP